MPSSTSGTHAGILIVLICTSLAFFVFTLERQADISSPTSSTLTILNEFEGVPNLLQPLSAKNGKPISVGKLVIDDSTSPDHYFEMYPREVLSAMEGTYSSHFNTSHTADEGPTIEIVSNTDGTRVFLPGIAYIDDGKPSSMMQLSKSKSLKSPSPKVSTQLLDSSSQISNNQLSHLKLDSLPKGFTVLTSSDPRVHIIETIVTKQDSPKKGMSPAKDTLIVFTTCNHIDMTVLALEFLKHSLDTADLIVVDDFSSDGTADYLVKKGFSVIKKDRPMGLTDSWNRGYRIAISMGYNYVVFANNDVLIPHGAIDSMRKDLVGEVLVVPLTTLKGSGHNPGQTLVLALEMSLDVEDYISNPNNVQVIQDALTKKVTEKSSEREPIGAKFEGERGYQHGHDSIHASKLSPENRIVKSIWKMKPRFNGFVFAVNVTGILSAAHNHPLTLFDPSGLIIGQEDKLIANMEKRDMMPMISLGAFVYHFKSVTVKMSRNKKKEDAREDLSKYHAGLGKSENEKKKPLKGFSSMAYPQLYSTYDNIVFQKPFQRLSAYPPLSPYAHIQRKYTGDVDVTPKKKEIVIAFATSDAVLLPYAGDVFTATELGKALVSEYQDVRIVHLYRGKDWYDPVKLQEVDVLVAFLDAFDLAKALKSLSSSIKNGPKPTLITIAWARNWFHRWLKQPWIGNYDMIFTSSILSQRFFEEYGKRYGLPVKCIHGCPTEKAPSLSCVTPMEVINDPYNPTPEVEGQGRILGSFVDVANEKAVSVFNSIFAISKPVKLSCTMTTKTKSSYGDSVTKAVRFEYLYSQKDGKGTLGGAPSAAGTVQSKPKSRSISGYRVKVPVRVLRIATNTEKFMKKGPIVEVKSPVDIASNLLSQKRENLRESQKRNLNAVPPKRSLQSAMYLSETERDVLNNADYAFTGSYYKVPRNIMSFDPLDLLPNYRGVIIGSGWQSAPNVTDEFRRIAIGSIPYSDLPNIYDAVKIVVDDANHVTLPWGSVNSRVFDALSSGALVITNGLLGSQETFQGKLPTYTTSEELTRLIRYYLSNDDVRKKLILELSQLVRKEHSYMRRGKEFATVLGDLGVYLKDRKAVKVSDPEKALVSSAPASTPVRAICIGVRTYDAHRSWLEVLLRSLIAQHSKSTFATGLDIQIFISDTERNTAFVPDNIPDKSPFTFSHALEEIVNRVNRDLNPDRSPQVHVVWDVNAPKRTYKNPFYGYDETDNLVDFMANLPQCEWMMMTNGDNAYNSAWFNAIAPLANDKSVDLIGWDFITHHKRNGNGQQHIRISMKRGFVDLASVLVRTSKIVESGARYLCDAMFTDDLFARDFYVLTEILKIVRPKAIRLLHRIFLLHQ